MTIEATAQALAEDTAVTADQSADAPAEEMNADQALEAVWDRMQTEEAEEPAEPEEAEEQPAETSEEEAEADTEADESEEQTDEEADDAGEEIEVPTDLPKAVRDAWKDIPESAREAVLESQRKMGRQLAEQGRLVQGISPIRDVLVEASQRFPNLSNMRPQEVAQELSQLAQISHDFTAKPVETMMSLIKQHRLEEPLKQALSGEQPQQAAMQNNALQQEIAQLKRQLSQVSDPEYLREQVETYTTQTQVASEVEQFSQTAEHWGDVEEHMPSAIQFVKASQPNASPKDVLARAYDLAVSQFVPEATKAKQQAATQAAPAVDPEKTQSARKAKSVNVRGTARDSKKGLTVDQMLEQTWKRMQD